MSDPREVTYTIDFGSRPRGRAKGRQAASFGEPDRGAATKQNIPRIARLMALAIRFEELVKDKKIRDYAELARLGRVTRARMTQMMKLRHLAPGIQEQILFLPPIKGLNERNLRHIVSRIDWDQQRRLFKELRDRLDSAGGSA